ncbi:hypothetical protein sscle_07g059240 [Sclerotinia sclerotiorum 1980 UF-70]|uniref:Uncharacterized protein n=1 Tax=Sclerotinia sclerotiorum (strain ATCC 18683 / 1980 / Ss-1) TaxID=665079 RepID=A0A1D9Q883_SCLS1|nr:hypothetical protein sscle_07g059240 [Sclerotinia sclerotiorum 1980 UF-70]
MASFNLAEFLGGSRPPPRDEGRDPADTPTPGNSPDRTSSAQNDETLPIPPPRLRGGFQGNSVREQLSISYAWLSKSVLYYIPFVLFLIGFPCLVIYVVYTRLSLGDDDKINSGILINLWKASLGRWGVSCGLIKILFWESVNIVVKAASWFGISPAWYHSVKTAVTSFVSSWFVAFTGWYNSASAVVTTSMEYLSGLKDTTMEHIKPSRLFHPAKWRQIISFSKYFLAFSMSTCIVIVTSRMWDPFGLLVISPLMVKLGPIKRACTYIIGCVKVLLPIFNIYKIS